ncbi:PTS system mannose/fructose/N-acetylgalactosamine-transporter subunit IIB [Caldanaerobacter subterraneus]|uniref:PTS sugar transporter subunit IIB n=1 Tax=Caldanaerobacter subterraneus TaxID=911092 RepID=A0A7Y2L6V5_9THEO|nr:PTS sugar transporter subunit IIB [Caldanaerobacter subterraneus]NNG66859.1 PTS sugar transporter subunit IIB [Caldanaerobacter subterraneus]
MSNYIRVDDRLIHGQIITKWAGYLNIRNIIVVDDKTANNPTLRSIMSMSVPKNYKTYICTLEESEKVIKNAEGQNNLIIVRYPNIVKKIYDMGIKFEFINIGNVSKKEGSEFEVTHNIFLTKEEIDIIEELHKKGVEIIFQLVPDTPAYTWEKERSKFFK